MVNGVKRGIGGKVSQSVSSKETRQKVDDAGYKFLIVVQRNNIHVRHEYPYEGWVGSPSAVGVLRMPLG